MPRRRLRSRANKLMSRTAGTILIVLFAWILTQLISHYPQDSTKLPGTDGSVAFYSNQTSDDLTELYQTAIASARQSITLAIYGLKDDTIIAALEKKCQEGIHVHIVCDSDASKDLSTRIPRALIVKRCGQGLMHQKILIIDGCFIILGSANLTYSSLNIHGNLVLALHHPELAAALSQRIKSMEPDGSFAPLLHRITKIGDQTLELWVLPDNQDATKRLTELFRSAKKSIRVAMFFWTRLDFAQEMIAAAKRGVTVSAVIDQNAGKGAGMKVVRLLDENGIPIYLSTGKGLLHHKFAYIDETILVNGSANWTFNAFNSNDDYFVILSPLNREQQVKVEGLWDVISQSAAPLTPSK